MQNQATPQISIIMPVFNTGIYLAEAINSVLQQKSTPECSLPDFELIVVDDHSTDAETLKILAAFSTGTPRVTVLKNQRTKGAAGARNTGILQSRGQWTGFLDSDDILTPTSLALRWQHIENNPSIEWIGARFKFLKPHTQAPGKQVFETAENIFASAPENPALPAIQCLRTPVAEFAKSCMVGIMTVLIRRDLVLEKNMFNENLPRAEDFHLWFQCAFQHDLWIMDADIAYYRIHSASLTHGDAPKLLHEDVMLGLLLHSPEGQAHKTLLLQRFDLVMQDTCYFYRDKKRFGSALRCSLQWIKKRPLHTAAWKELIACGLRIS